MPKDKHTAPAGAAKTAKKGGGTAPWTLGLGWLFSFLLVILAALLMLLTTLCSAGYMKSRVSACGYGETAYVTMREQFIGYGAATGFSEETMTTVLDPVQIEQDMKDSIDGLYAKSPYRYDRPAIAERAYAAMEAEAAERGITLEGDTAANVQVVAEAVRQVYASATAVPLVEGAAEALRDGFVSGGTRRNLDWVREDVRAGAGIGEEDLLLLADAQTSGGLLVIGEVPGYPIIGETVEGAGIDVR